MKNNIYEEYYDKQYLANYKKKEIIKSGSICEENHTYSIDVENREKLYDLEVYTIDPEGSTDADDGFSIEHQVETDKLYLYIHIADPTEYIELKSNLWNQICSQSFTMYPTNRNPIHLMPDVIIHSSSLQENEYEYSLKNAITVKMGIDKGSYKMNGENEIFPSHIKVKKCNKFSYKNAGENAHILFNECLEIAKNLRANRGIYASKLSEVNNAYPVFDNKTNIVSLHVDGENEVKIKQMIAEFAIISNHIVADYICKNLKERHNIYRSCDLRTEDKDNMKSKNGAEIIEYIVSNGVRACYNSLKTKHDLVGKDNYIHFTSPLRRVSDCVCHYILKYIFKKKGNEKIRFPFKKEMLMKIEEHCNKRNKEIKKWQYNDNKYRIIQAMDNLLFYKFFNNMYSPSQIEIEFKLLSYSGIFLNIHVTKIDEYPVYLTMTFRKKFLNGNKINEYIHKKEICRGRISVIIFYECMHDGGKFPELEQLINTLFG